MVRARSRAVFFKMILTFVSESFHEFHLQGWQELKGEKKEKILTLSRAGCRFPPHRKPTHVL